MIITRKYAMSLVRSGKATVDGYSVMDGIWWDAYNGAPVYGCLTRYDAQRVDHYPATDTEWRSWEAKQ